ncbi:lipopolysaccharide transport periplasmic protein LptA [Microbulbifer sp. YPW16]|uniref:lipopolysaccharide transport periplasmic protein LptA n=1 Tax=Microbulbifer sp. YPW16 TaxID=2904242 RepID=UPI001E417A5F|nr:lipopolysaccharide transport periplasmic protein LptA [Microbulbifer sp. YPW16]UHQ54811.1 lipopolysaccharide transport periplasmic protein LptA [Microbulbifer sp. YPW16]
MKLNKFLCALAVTTLLLQGMHATALPSDRQQPVKVNAQKLEANRGKNLSVYSGNVVITQGSLQIRADRVEVHGNPEGEIRRVIATGNPAHFQQQMQQSQNLVKARARRIEFKVNADELQLTGDAHVDRDGNTLAAERIDYDLNSEKMQAQGQSGDGRVEMIWKPERKPEGTAPADSAEDNKDSTEGQ